MALSPEELHSLIKQAEHILALRRPLTEQERAALIAIKASLKMDIQADKAASTGLGAVLGGAAASILFGPLALLPIAAGVLCGGRFGSYTHEQACKQAKEVIARIEQRLLAEGS